MKTRTDAEIKKCVNFEVTRDTHKGDLMLYMFLSSQDQNYITALVAIDVIREKTLEINESL